MGYKDKEDIKNIFVKLKGLNLVEVMYIIKLDEHWWNKDNMLMFQEGSRKETLEGYG